MKKLAAGTLLIGLGTWLFYRFILEEVLLRLTLNNEWPLSPLVIYSINLWYRKRPEF